MISSKAKAMNVGNRVLLKDFYLVEENSEEDFQNLIKFISSNEGIDLSCYREKYLKRRFYHITQKYGMINFRNYLQILKTNPDKTKEFIKGLTIHVTSFFRDLEYRL